MDENTAMNNNPVSGERTFTQEEVNRIVGERLAKEKAKGEAALAEREQQFEARERELANREALYDLKDKLKDMGLPEELLPVLNVQDKAALQTALDALKEYIDEKKPHRHYIENKLPESDSRDDGNYDTEIRKAMGLL